MDIKEEELLHIIEKVDTLFPVPLSKKISLHELAHKLYSNGLLSIIRENNEIVAIVGGYANDKESGLAYISIVATISGYMGKGYGTAAVKKFAYMCKEKGMKAIHLYAVMSNVSAIKMYKKIGFMDYFIENEPRPNDAHLILYL